MKFKQLMEKHRIEGSKSLQIIGYVGVIKVKNPKKDFLEELASRMKLKAIVNLERIEGEFRRPVARLVYGESAETIHKEYGILYALNPLEVMFSKGNLNERIRIAKLARDGEKILDMFAGIGYFSIPIAKLRKVEIVALEKNPTAFKYLLRNIELNKVSGIRPYLVDNREFVSEEKFDRIIMGYFPGTERFLEAAKKFSKPSTVIHYHNLAIHPREMVEQIHSAFPDAIIERIVMVKEYNPAKKHFCIDFEAGK